MQPVHERSESVVARVVAWHNRHPLAARITPDQVQSVGVVSLPFAVQGAVVEPLPVPVPEPPTAEAAAPPEPTPPPPPAEPAAVPDDVPSTMVELVTETDAASPADAPTILDRALDAAAAPGATPLPDAAGAAAAEAPHTPMPAPLRLRRLVTLPSRPPRRGWRGWWQQLRGRTTFRALFSEDFIAPLAPRRVAAWAADHGTPDWPLEPEAPLRLVMLDPSLRRAGDEAPELDLHLITAAVGVGEQRLRLLLAPGPQGAIIGPRHWNRARVAAATAPLVLLLLGAFAGVLHTRGRTGAEPEPLAAASAPASAPVAHAQASGSAVHAHASAPVAPAPASGPVAHAPASAPVVVAGAPAARAAASAPELRAGPEPVVAASAPSAVVALAPAAPPAVPRPPDVAPQRGRIDLPPLVPRLASGERQALRQVALGLRGPDPRAAPARAWALATRPLSDRRQSERAAAQLQALALIQRLPLRAELMHSGGAWRAVFWPFGSAADAEKVRLALADKGLRTELIEF
ncbi:MAG: hypothetical protein U1F56_10560 [Rubrivivax sp.]